MARYSSDRALEAVARATAIAAEALPREQMLARLVAAAREGTQVDFCAIYLENPERARARGAWALEAWSGGDARVLGLLPADDGEANGVLAPLFHDGREVDESDLLPGAPSRAAPPPGFPARSTFAVPLRRRDGRAVGAVVAGARRAGHFDDARRTVVRAVAQLAAVAVDNARLAAAQQRDRRMAAESAVTLGTVLESVGSGVCVLDLEGNIRLANRVLQELFGLEGRLIGVPQYAALAEATSGPKAREAFLARVREMIEDPSIEDESEWELSTDPPRIVQRHAAPMRNLLGEIVGRVEVYVDVTEGRRLYTQLLRSERLRAIGEMASGIAHDFNNLLASIVGQTELVHADDQPAATRQAISTIRQAALDGARMVRNMQDYARSRGERSGSAADLNQEARTAVDLARPRWAGASVRGEGPIEVETDLTPADRPGPLVAIDPGELREILLNVLFNAADAMPQGGRIHVRTRPARGGTAELVVSDTGHGMSAEVQARIFEPFFTTKGPRGSGLGLAVTYSIVARLGGQIDVESAPGRGTTLTIRLPLAAGRRAAAEPGGAVGRGSRRLASRRILAVDDEPGLLSVVRQLLERSGAQVQTAEGGRLALDLLQAVDAKYDAILTDLDMPEVDGWAVAAAAKARDPDRPVVMLTGWAGEIPPDEFKRRGIDAVLAKPSRRAELEATIADLVEARPAAARPRALRILLVEDDPVFARSLRDLLLLRGHEVEMRDSAAGCLEALEGASFDVVVTDYRLGDTSGAQLAERVATRASAPPVVLITGYATSIDDPTLMTPGIAAVLPKPCRADDIRAALERVTTGSAVSSTR